MVVGKTIFSIISDREEGSALRCFTLLQAEAATVQHFYQTL